MELGRARPWLDSLIALSAFGAVVFFAAFHDGFEKRAVYDPSGDPKGSEEIRGNWSVDEVLDRFGGRGPNRYQNADLAAYLVAAEHLRTEGTWEKEYMGLRTAGLPIIIAGVTSLFGTDNYLTKMVVFNAAAWTIAFFVFFSVLPFGRSRLLRFVALSAIFLLPSFREWTFGFGSVLTESSSSALFVMAVALLARGVVEKRRGWFIGAGILLGLATHVRSYYLYIANAMLLYALVTQLVVWIVRRARASKRLSLRALYDELLRRNEWASRPRTKATQYLLLFGLAFLVFVATLEPWRMYKFSRMDSRRLVHASLKYAYYHSWQPEDQIPWFVKAGDAACRVDPSLCKVVWNNIDALSGEDVRNLVIMTMAAHPLDYAWVKLSNFNWLWFGREWSYIFLEKPWMALEGFTLLALAVVGLVQLGIAYKKTRAVELLVFGLSIGWFIAINAAVFGAYTYEWRYSQGMRALAFFLPFAVSAVRWPARFATSGRG